MSDSRNRDAITCEGRENDYADTDTPIERLKKIAANLICFSRSKADGDDPISESFGYTLEAMDQYADHILAVVADLEQPSAGTSAYEMVAAIETQNVEVTETLIQMTAATVLAKLIEDEGGGRSNISFSPADMDAMHQRYVLHASRDGLVTTVKLEPRPDAFTEPPTSFYAEQGADASEPAKPQAAEHVFDRPLWAARIDGKLFPASDQGQAQALVGRADVGQIAQVENRFCYHPECPAEHCNRAVNQTALVSDQDGDEPDSREVTSGVDSPDA